MSDKYEINLISRNEGLDYEDEFGVFHFNVILDDGIWTVVLPCSKGDAFDEHCLTPEERLRILPRIKKYLSCIRWLGLFKRTYGVRISEER